MCTEERDVTNVVSNVMPLEGYKVIDLSNMLTGPYCTRMLSDYGAEVIKVEPKTGDPARMHGPFLNDDPDSEKSGLFLFLNTNKRSITVDIETEEGQDVIRELVKDASIVVENFKPGYLESLGLGYDALSDINPNLVMTSITNFGQTGPYKDWEGVDLTIWAMGGAMKTSGNGDYEPLKMAGRIASFHVGSVASLATLTALWQAEFQDEGDHVDV
ncbi:MAG: CoA transferase, partial [SAR202 cluster bacterium]|nr:CoA transferase [SAR202 cluster bacterium]